MYPEEWDKERKDAHLKRVYALVADVQFPDMKFKVRLDSISRVYIQVGNYQPNDEGELVFQGGRKWDISEHACDSEIIQTCFLAVKTWQEHEAREFFTYKGRNIFGPHYDLNALVELIDQKKFDTRK